jgi:hypothetical protein
MSLLQHASGGSQFWPAIPSDDAMPNHLAAEQQQSPGLRRLAGNLFAIEHGEARGTVNGKMTRVWPFPSPVRHDARRFPGRA